MKKTVVTLMAAGLLAGAIVAMPVYADDYDQVTFAYATMNNLPTEEGLSTVQEAVNEITREKIGVEVTLKPIGLADYTQSVTLSLQAGEKIDVLSSIYTFASDVSNGMLYDITDLIDEAAPETKELIGEDWLKTCMYEGSLYALPTYKPVASHGYFVCRQDILDELGIDVSTVKSAEDLTDIFAQVAEAHPEMTVLAPLSQGNLDEGSLWYGIDYLSDSREKAYGVLFDGDTTVKNLYESDYFMEQSKLVREWYEAGYIMKDAATTTSSVSELMTSGNYFGHFTENGLMPEDLAAILTSLEGGGNPITVIDLREPYISTSTINMVTWGIASNTKVPEAAMKFLNLTYTDPDVLNLIIFGLEGRDYVLDEDGCYGYPEGQDAATVPYTAALSNGIIGNAFIMHRSVGTSEEDNEALLEANKTATVSPALGFMFDSTDVSIQYTAVNNVASQYLPGLLCGSTDPETELPAFVDALNAAGLQDIIDAKQKQLDVWLAENK